VYAAGWNIKREDEVLLVEQPDRVSDPPVVDAFGDRAHDRRAHAEALEVLERLLLRRLLVAAAAQQAQLGVAERVQLQADVDVSARASSRQKSSSVAMLEAVRGDRDARDLGPRRDVEEVEELRCSVGSPPDSAIVSSVPSFSTSPSMIA
jgi:hypothetical protein